ncbi:hypothetical protein [Capnocytophaga leadbetteri]
MKKRFLDLKNIIFMILASIISYLICNNYENNESNKKLISTTIMAMNNKVSEISFMNIEPIWTNYNDKDTLFCYKNPVELDYLIFYDELLKSRGLDDEFRINILDFQKKSRKLLKDYTTKDSDFLRKKISNTIVLEIQEEKDILEGELNYLNGEISKDSLKKVRENTFRKYISFNLDNY